jgi:predicted PurR-regulated permease PerM
MPRRTVTDRRSRVAESLSAPSPPGDGAAPEVPRVRGRTLQTALLGGLFFIAVLALLVYARALLVPMVAAALLAMTLMPAVNRLRSLGLPHPLAASVVAIALLLFLAGLSYLLIQPFDQALDALPALEGLAHRLARLSSRIYGEPYTEWVLERLHEAAAGGGGASAGFFISAGETIVLAGATLVLTFFLLLSGNLFLQRLVQVLPRVRDKVKAVRVVNAVQEDVGRYLATVTLVNFVVGIIVGSIAWYWDLPAPLLLGTVAGLLNYVPYVGAITNVLLLLLASGATYTAFGEIFAAPVAFATIAALEGNVITPLIVGRRTQLNAVTVVFALVFWGWVWGIVGMVLAIPLLLVVKGFATHIERLEPINAFMSR